MTKKERAEKQIEKHLRAIERIYESLDPGDEALCMSIGQKYIFAFNKHWELPPEKAVDISMRRFTDDDFDS